MENQRKIIHVDMDAFYASVEQRDNPDYRGKPLMVGGGKRGVVAAASYEARAFGVRSAMPTGQALRLCPDIVVVKPRFEVYKETSLTIRKIFQRYTHAIEPLSLDEAYLDVTENIVGERSATRIAERIRADIWKECFLTASAGVSYCKFIAKVASDFNKPNGMTVVPPSDAVEFIGNLDVGKFHGVGSVTERKMNEAGIYTGKDLREYTESALVRMFGKSGSWFYNVVRGIDNRPVRSSRERKSVSAETTFGEDVSDLGVLDEKLLLVVQRAAKRIEATRSAGFTVTLKIKYFDFEQHTRSKTMSHSVSEAQQLYEVGKALLYNSPIDKPVRLLGIGISNLADGEHRSSKVDDQLTLEM